jgi:hypothetical protein
MKYNVEIKKESDHYSFCLTFDSLHSSLSRLNIKQKRLALAYDIKLNEIRFYCPANRNELIHLLYLEDSKVKKMRIVTAGEVNLFNYWNLHQSGIFI